MSPIISRERHSFFEGAREKRGKKKKQRTFKFILLRGASLIDFPDLIIAGVYYQLTRLVFLSWWMTKHTCISCLPLATPDQSRYCSALIKP